MKIARKLSLLAAVVLVYAATVVDCHAWTPKQQAWQNHASFVEYSRGLPNGMLRAICEQESHWRNVRGQHGEIGICQIRPSTVRFLAPEIEHQVDEPVLYRYGAKGQTVEDIQSVLAHRGLYAGPLDGIWGDKTHAAVLRFQELEQLAADGVVGPRTWAKLFPGHKLTRTIEQRLWDPEENIEWAAAWLNWCSTELQTENPVVLMGCFNGGAGNPVVRYQASVLKRWEQDVDEYYRPATYYPLP